MKLHVFGATVLLLIAQPVLAAPPDVKPSPDTPVSVTNTSANPVPVTLQGTSTISGTVGINGTVATKSVEDPGRSPFSARLNVNNAVSGCQTLGGGYQACDFTGGFPTVPAGKRLVITDFSGQASAPSGCVLVEISLTTNNEGGGDFGNPITYAIPNQSASIPSLFNFHERILAFVEPGSSPTFSVTASCAGLSVFLQIATLSGYFVSLP